MAKTLLVPVDLDHEKTFERLFEAVREQTAAEETPATVQLLTVVPNFAAGMFPYVPHDMVEQARAEAQDKLAALAREQLGDAVDWHSEARIGPVARTIVDVARAHEADLIVMASHDPTTIDLLLGSTADQVVRRAHCSVLIVRQGG